MKNGIDEDMKYRSTTRTKPTENARILAQSLAINEHCVGEDALGLRVGVALRLSRQLRNSLHGYHLCARRWIWLKVFFGFRLQLLDELHCHVRFLVLLMKIN